MKALRTSYACGLSCPESFDAAFGLAQDKLRRGACSWHARRSRKGQQVLEYAVLLSALSMVFLVMYMYGKRGLQGIIRGSAMQVGTQRDSQPMVTTIDTSGSSWSQDTKSENTRVTTAGETANFTYDSNISTTGVATTTTVSY